MLKIIRQSFWMRSMAFSMMQKFSLVFFSAATFFILARFFSNTQLAIWGLYITIITTIDVTKQGLLRNALIKNLHVKEWADKKNELQSASLLINILFTVIVSLLLLIFAHTLALKLKFPELENLFYWGILYLVAIVPFNHCEIVLQANFQFKHNFYAYIIRQFIFFIYIVVCRFAFQQGIQFVPLSLVHTLGTFLGAMYFLNRSAPYLYKTFRFNKQIFFSLLDFGKFVFGTALFSNISKYVDQFLSAGLVSDKGIAVSYYGVVSRVNTMMDTPTFAAADILFPKNAQAGTLEGFHKVKYYFEKMVATLTAVVLPLVIFIAIFPKFVLWIFAGNKYVDASFVLLLSVSTALLRPFYYNVGHTLDSIGKPGLNFWLNITQLIFNSFITYYFIKYFGYIGAAYATVVAIAVFSLIFFFILKKYLHIELRNILLYMKETYQQLFGMIAKFVRK